MVRSSLLKVNMNQPPSQAFIAKITSQQNPALDSQAAVARFRLPADAISTDQPLTLEEIPPPEPSTLTASLSLALVSPPGCELVAAQGAPTLDDEDLHLLRDIHSQ